MAFFRKRTVDQRDDAGESSQSSVLSVRSCRERRARPRAESKADGDFAATSGRVTCEQKVGEYRRRRSTRQIRPRLKRMKSSVCCGLDEIFFYGNEAKRPELAAAG